MRLVITAVLWAMALAGGIGATAGLNHAIGTDASAATTTSVTAEPTDPADPTPEPPSDTGDPYDDITSRPPSFPDDDTAVSANSPQSLLRPANLDRVLTALKDDYGRKANVSQLSIYPGAVEVVLVEEGGAAQLVDATLTGGNQLLTNGEFYDSLSTEYLGDVDAAVPLQLITLGAKQPALADRTVTRLVFVPDLTTTDAGLEVDYTGTQDTIVAELDGTKPVLRTPTGTTKLY